MFEYIKCILIIGNREDIQKVIKLSIELAVDWEVLSASSGYEGSIVARNRQLDAILLDAGIRDEDGSSALKLLKTNLSTRSIPIIVIAETDRCAEQFYFKNLGATAVVSELFDPANLAREIAQVLNWR